MFSEPSGHCDGGGQATRVLDDITDEPRMVGPCPVWKRGGVCIWGINAVAATVPQGGRTGWKEAESYKEAGLFCGRCSRQ